MADTTETTTTTTAVAPETDVRVPFTNRVMTPDFEARFAEALSRDGKGKARPAVATEPAAEPAATEPAKTAATEPAKTEPAVESKADPATVEEEIPASIARTEKAATEWKKLKAAHKAEMEKFRAQVAEMEAKLKSAPASSDTELLKKDLEALKRERDEYSEQLRMLDVERHPKFRAYYDAQVTAQVEKAKQIVGPERAGEIAEILALPESAWKAQRVNELIADLTPYQQTRLGATLDKLADISLEREGEIRKARENFAKIEAEKAAAAKAAEENTVRAFDKTVETLDDTWVMYKPREGDAEWNNGVKERMEFARAIYRGELEPQDLAKQALLAASVPTMLKAFEAQVQRAKALEDELKELRAASPKPTEGGASEEAVDDTKGLSFRDGLERRAAALFNR